MKSRRHSHAKAIALALKVRLAITVQGRDWYSNRYFGTKEKIILWDENGEALNAALG